MQSYLFNLISVGICELIPSYCLPPPLRPASLSCSLSLSLSLSPSPREVKLSVVSYLTNSIVDHSLDITDEELGTSIVSIVC